MASVRETPGCRASMSTAVRLPRKTYRALANFDTIGDVKPGRDQRGGLIIGALMPSADAGDVIQTAAGAIRMRTTLQDLGDWRFGS